MGTKGGKKMQHKMLIIRNVAKLFVLSAIFTIWLLKMQNANKQDAREARVQAVQPKKSFFGFMFNPQNKGLKYFTYFGTTALFYFMLMENEYPHQEKTVIPKVHTKIFVLIICSCVH